MILFRNPTVLTLFLCIFAVGINAQNPKSILISESDTPSTLRSCDSDAGTISIGEIDAQSNHIGPDTLFLCFGDRVFMEHNGDFDLSGDPDPTTAGGIGYAWYDCPPEVDGPTLQDIIADPCVLLDPPPANDLWVYVDNPNGNAWFENGFNIDENTTIQDFFNNGDPVQLYFAPITFDALDDGSAVYEGSPSGECVSVSIDEAFSVVYLNPITIEGLTHDGGNEDIEGSFTVDGGLPEFDGSEYNMTIQLKGSSKTAEITTGPAGSGDLVEFIARDPGTYIFTISDGKSCTLIAEFCLGDCLDIYVSDAEVEEGEEFCLEVSVNNFEGMLALTGAFTWNPNIIEFISVSNISLPEQLNLNTGFAASGWITFIWFDEDGGDTGGQSVPDSTVIIELCFRAVGNPGQSSLVNPTERLTTDLIALKANDNSMGVFANPGLVQILYPEELGMLISSCGSPEGESVGNLTVLAYGGEPPYEVFMEKSDDDNISGEGSIAEVGGSITFFDLPPTPDANVFYEIFLVDNLGDTVMVEGNIHAGGPPEVQFITTDPTCFNAANGSIEAEITGEGPFTIEWSNGSFADSIIRNLGVGSYTLSVTDGFGCEISESIELTFDPIELNATITDASCEGIPDGSITLMASGGEPINGNEYRYDWEGRSPQTSTVSTLSNISSGVYSIIVTDANGCRTVDSFEVGFEIGIGIEDMTIEHESCPGAMDGSIALTAGLEGTVTDPTFFIWSWRDASNTLLPSITIGCCENILEDIGMGSYTLTVADTSGCESVFTFEIEAPDPIVIDLVEIQDTPCDEPGNGSVEIEVSGGEVNTPTDYTIMWDNGQTGTLLDGVEAGTYTVVVSDLNNCEAMGSFTVEEANAAVIDSITQVPASCATDNQGSLTVHFTPGTGNVISVDWEDQDQTPYSGSTISGLSAGTYTVYILSDDGCVTSQTVELEVAGELVLQEVVLDSPSCPGDSDGRISIIIDGSPGALSYEWSVPGAPDQAVLTDLPAGNYSVTVSQLSGECDPLEIDDIVLEDPEPLAADFIDIVGTNCHDSCDGRAEIQVSGGSSGGVYTYLWENELVGPFNPTLCAGENGVLVSDGLCVDTFFVDIPSPNPISLDLTEIQNPTCFGDEDGLIEVSISGGTGPDYVLNWDDPDQSIGSLLFNVPGGSYQLEVIDINNCRDTFEFILEEPDSLILDINPNSTQPISCAGREDGQIDLMVSGGNGGFQFNWQPDVTDQSSAMDLAAGLYEIEVIDQNGCSDTTSYLMEEASPLEFTYDLPENINCFGETTPFTVSDAQGGSGGPYRFAINFGGLFSLGDSVELFAGNYIVSVFDEAGCSVTDSFSLDQPAEIMIELPSQIEVQLGETVQLDPDIMDPVPVSSYLWMTENDILDCYDCRNPLATPIAEETITLMVENQNGCTASASTTFILESIRNIYIPNAFSPNNDGINDLFRVYTGIGVRAVPLLRVYDRWGSLVFERSHISIDQLENAGWDGTIQGEEAAPGSYVYMVEIEFTDGFTEVYSGEVVLIR